MIENITNNYDSACNFCIQLLEELSKTYGVSYGELNVWLFVIIQPALILLFLTTTIVLTVRLYRRNREFQYGNIIVAIASSILVIAYAVVLITFCIILIPIYAMI